MSRSTRKIPVGVMASALVIAMECAACNESDPGLVSDTSTDGTPDAVVSTCALVSGWALGIEQDSNGVGTVSGTVSLDSDGTASSCAGPPCLVVTVITGGGEATGITQTGSNEASFTYTNAGMAAGGEAQLLLRWRVLCTADSGSDEERTVSLPVRACADTAARLSLVAGACP